MLKRSYVKNKFDQWSDVVYDITIDSRKVTEKSLFIAYKGYALNGHEFIKQAIENGATTILLEDENYINDSNINFILVNNAKILLGEIASAFYDNPSSSLKVVGITGTNGKTTVASLLHNLFFNLGFKSGLLSTIINKVGEKELSTNLTTPDAISIQKMFRQMVDEGVEYVFMEVSSHALDQGRVSNVQFDIAVFTNISRDHLDYHDTFLDYINAKRKLFNDLPKSAKALVNIDDVNGKIMIQNSKANVVTYALRKPADFKVKILSNSIEGLHLVMQGHEVYLKLIGDFNAYNAMAVYGVATMLGIDEMEVLTSLSNLIAIEGRMDIVKSDVKGITGVIDYAHTPDALEQVLTTIAELNIQKGRIITVVGCGGNRDKGKRPLMGKIASRLSTITVLTSDNPRDENPNVIIEEMMEGVEKENEEKVVKIENRKEAIKMAALMAKPGDIILIAGKGHEKYQEIKGQKLPFNDKKIFSAFMH
ncbi:MAG: UDP-N-acetylmuramoyl-L-alanyl-D-glutamate--2,6-diaminopimelate ligase [Saprospiraceae bacterium]|nr:UDP-N-acetylmuramoyl-L-alanyl-D-glutamate--2,6-diaminopimelate ligase [Bacteroidia bacterium]NNL91731.1 UDP-N-acetylmuramoyl-L-alanyl-D-glutamate--2,6-diaminopimelate ligase [Saprospiraceae bacterium]